MGYINHTSSLSSALRTQLRLHMCLGVGGFIIILRVRTWKLIPKELPVVRQERVKAKTERAFCNNKDVGLLFWKVAYVGA
jgi:hypothetical protein